MSKKLKIKHIDYIKLFFSNKLFLYNISIDIIFYSYISIFFALYAYISFVYDFDFKLMSLFWILGFFIILLFKLKKDFK
jgi:hypothetical protein